MTKKCDGINKRFSGFPLFCRKLVILAHYVNIIGAKHVFLAQPKTVPFIPIPFVIEQDGRSERSFDIYSRMMKDRVIILNGQVHDQMASAIIAQLMFLKLDGEDGKEISMYINSPGGSVTAGLAIYDVMQNIIETTER